MATVVDQTKCTGCGICAEICPSDAIVMHDGKAVVTVECVECGTCIDECPDQAIHK